MLTKTLNHNTPEHWTFESLKSRASCESFKNSSEVFELLHFLSILQRHRYPTGHWTKQTGAFQVFAKWHLLRRCDFSLKLLKYFSISNVHTCRKLSLRCALKVLLQSKGKYKFCFRRPILAYSLISFIAFLHERIYFKIIHNYCFRYCQRTHNHGIPFTKQTHETSEKQEIVVTTMAMIYLPAETSRP